MARVVIENVPEELKRNYHSETVGDGRTMREDLMDYMTAAASGEEEQVMVVVRRLMISAGIPMVDLSGSGLVDEYVKRTGGK